MRISINGFGQDADMLHIHIPKHADWMAFTNVLSIGGVICYYTQAGTIGVRYKRSVDPIDVAAQALIVTAAFCDTPLEEVEAVVKKRFIEDVDESRIAGEVRSRMLTMPAPAHVYLYDMEMRGLAPAYWLK